MSLLRSFASTNNSVNILHTHTHTHIHITAHTRFLRPDSRSRSDELENTCMLTDIVKELCINYKITNLEFFTI